MELRHLRYFIAVAEELHFGRAAARLNIAAPTLSHQIRALETLLGAKLLTRKTKSAVALTHSGRRFLVEAQNTLKQAAHAEQVGRRAGRGEAGSISVGLHFLGRLQRTDLVDLGQIQKNPSECIVSDEADADLRAVQSASLDGTLDVGFAQAPQRYPYGLTGFVIDRQPFWAVLPEGHHLAARKQVTPAMLADEGFVTISLEMETGFWRNIAAVSPPGMAPRIVERAPDAFTVMTLVAAGVGISVLSEAFTRVAMPGLVFRKIVGVNRTSDLGVVYRKNESAPVVKTFVDFLRMQARLS